jgi:L-ascorbate metabolism protein UlaG (beta-lactamase superfamily)
MRLLRRIGSFLVLALAALCLAPSVVPPFLDRIYYRGPASDHYDGRRFFNRGDTPGQARGSSFFGRWFSEDRARWPEQVAVTPARPPARVEGEAMEVTWIGHATVLIQSGGLNILTDPVWAERASPFPFIGPKRVRAPGVRFEDLPRIDLVLISHNHYDHMDLATLERLWRRDRPTIVTSLGNDTILKHRGIEAVALDWGGKAGAYRSECLAAGNAECMPLGEVTVLRNHHWGSRWSSDRNRALWSGFKVALPGGSIFFAGDTGWGDGGWVREAAAQGPYRLALIPIGAYEPRDFMKTHHINPQEAVAMFEALDPAVALGIHWGTFQLTFEPIGDPPARLAALRRARAIAENRFVAPDPGQTFAVPLRK